MLHYAGFIRIVLVFLSGLSLYACALTDHNENYNWNMIYPARYDIAGRVSDHGHMPVKGAEIYLIQRQMPEKGDKDNGLNNGIIRVGLMASSDNNGLFSFAFKPEPLANDIWIGFLDPDNVFQYKTVCINDKLGDAVLNSTGTSPVVLNVFMDKSDK